MPRLVNITYSTTPDFAWRSANVSAAEWWEKLAADPILGPRWDRVNSHRNGCWFLQMAPSNQSGHILLSEPGGARVYAHRRAYEVAFGAIPKRKVVRHSCDDPACVNPAHLLVGSQIANLADCVARGRRNAFGRQRLQDCDAADVRARFAAGQRQKDIAAAYGVSKGCIHAVVHGLTHNGILAATSTSRPSKVVGGVR